jgi:peptidoglycan/LPS O-acetylase OafA/YrhL
MNVFPAFVVLAGSALSLFLINLQTVPLALSAAAAAAVLVRTLIQKRAIWVPLTAALLVWIGALVVYAACSGQAKRAALVVLVAAAVVLAILAMMDGWDSLGAVARILLVLLAVVLTGASDFGAASWIDPNVLASRWTVANATDAQEKTEALRMVRHR